MHNNIIITIYEGFSLILYEAFLTVMPKVLIGKDKYKMFGDQQSNTRQWSQNKYVYIILACGVTKIAPPRERKIFPVCSADYSLPVLVVVLSCLVRVPAALLGVGVVVILLVVGWLRVVRRRRLLVLERGPRQPQRRLRGVLPLFGGRRARSASSGRLLRLRLQVRPGPLVAQIGVAHAWRGVRLPRQRVRVAWLPPPVTEYFQLKNYSGFQSDVWEIYKLADINLFVYFVKWQIKI